MHSLTGGACCARPAPPAVAAVPERERLVTFLATHPPDAILRAVRAEKAKRSLYEFFRQAFEHVLEPGVTLEDGPHIAAICDHVQWQLEERARVAADPSHAAKHECPDVLVNVPPRCLKTLIVQVAAVAWAWLHWPQIRVLCLSVNPRVSTDSADKCRTLIQSDWYQQSFRPTWQIREDKDGVLALGNDAGGIRAARGLDSNVVGEGADWRIIDDPDDPDNVHSELVRAGVERRWQNSIQNRKNDPRSTITTGLQQRCHIDDWSSHRIAEGWIVVRLPMEFVPARACTTPMPVDANRRFLSGARARWSDWRTVAGHVLHPRFSGEWCAKERAKGEYRYAAQYQQEPASPEGGIFKKKFWKFFRLEGEAIGPFPRPDGCATIEASPARTIRLAELDWIAFSVDATFGKSAGADNVGLLVVGGKGADRFVLHDGSKRMNYPETKAAIGLTPGEGLRGAYPRVVAVLIERKANGQALIDELVSAVPGTIGIDPEGGKESRAAATAPSVQAGQWYLLEGAPWLSAFVEEWAAFPNGRHDDRVDAGTQLQIYFADKGWSTLFASAWGAAPKPPAAPS